ncbi:MAG: DUF3105 domain-containing protein [Myxococcales bacterium]|nr:DUF3105 domain-containing protein [Myxococcales bacterium]
MIVVALFGCPGATDPVEATPATEGCEACEGDCLTTFTSATSAQHDTGDLTYVDEPPTSGDHHPCWASWGVHTEAVPAENWVHNLEHGGIVFLYDCPGGCDDDLAELTTYVSGLTLGRAVLTAYAPSVAQFTAVAWEHKLELACFDQPSLAAFFDEHVGKSPEDVLSEPSAACM